MKQGYDAGSYSNSTLIGYRAGKYLDGDSNVVIGSNAAAASGNSGSYNVIIGYNACNSLTSSNNLCIGSNGNNLIAGNFNTGIVVLGSTSGYAHVPGDLYVGGTIYEGTNPSNSNDNGGKSNDDSNGGANASDNQGSDSNEDFDLVIDRDPDDGSGGNSDDIRREVEKYAKLNSRLECRRNNISKFAKRYR